MPLSIDEATGTIIIEGGRDDDQAGIRIRQSGDAFDRYAVLPDGSVLTGDGTADPAGAQIGASLYWARYGTPWSAADAVAGIDTYGHDFISSFYANEPSLAADVTFDDATGIFTAVRDCVLKIDAEIDVRTSGTWSSGLFHPATVFINSDQYDGYLWPFASGVPTPVADKAATVPTFLNGVLYLRAGMQVQIRLVNDASAGGVADLTDVTVIYADLLLRKIG